MSTIYRLKSVLAVFFMMCYTPSQEQTGCVNNNALCDIWAGRGVCTTQQDFMHDHCPQACGLCSTGTSPQPENVTTLLVCQDINALCSEWAGRGICTTLQDFMQINCPQTCGLCHMDTTQPPTIAQPDFVCGRFEGDALPSHKKRQLGGFLDAITGGLENFRPSLGNINSRPNTNSRLSRPNTNFRPSRPNTNSRPSRPNTNSRPSRPSFSNILPSFNFEPSVSPFRPNPNPLRPNTNNVKPNFHPFQPGNNLFNQITNFIRPTLNPINPSFNPVQPTNNPFNPFQPTNNPFNLFESIIRPTPSTDIANEGIPTRFNPAPANPIGGGIDASKATVAVVIPVTSMTPRPPLLNPTPVPNPISVAGGISPTVIPLTPAVEVRLEDSICGTVPITDRFLLSAAHCFHDPNQKFKVRFGHRDFSQNGESNSVPQEVDIEKIYIHPGYRHSTGERYNDIALLKSAQKIQLSSVVFPYCVLPRSIDFTGKILTVSGFGLVNSTHRSPVLQEAQLEGLNAARCEERYLAEDYEFVLRRPYPDLLQGKGILCASAPGKSACQGDSGGPLTAKDSRGKTYLIGIVSIGVYVDCGNSFSILPGLYTEVAHYIDWIDQVVYST